MVYEYMYAHCVHNKCWSFIFILPESEGESTKRDAVTMSWKYAAMEIYGLLSDVRDTDAEEMHVRIIIIMEMFYNKNWNLSN